MILPLTAKAVAGFKGSYCNYYVANKVVLMPTYSDVNDAAAMRILEKIYPGRTVIGIDCRKLYPNGGMVYCVTQQQPKWLVLRIFVSVRSGIPGSQHLVHPRAIHIDDFERPLAGGNSVCFRRHASEFLHEPSG